MVIAHITSWGLPLGVAIYTGSTMARDDARKKERERQTKTDCSVALWLCGRCAGLLLSPQWHLRLVRERQK